MFQEATSEENTQQEYNKNGMINVLSDVFGRQPASVVLC